MFPPIDPPHAAIIHMASTPTDAPAHSVPLQNGREIKRPLPAGPNLEFDQKRAKELLKAYRAGEPEAVTRIHEHYPAPESKTVTLATAQLVIAREHGFASWPRLKQHILWPYCQLAVTLMDRGDVYGVRDLLRSHPDIVKVRTPHPEAEPLNYFSGAYLLHYVAGNPDRGPLSPRTPEIAAMLLQQGANPNAQTLSGGTTIGLVLTSRAASQAGIAPALLDVLKSAGARDNVEDEETLLSALRNSAPETAAALAQRGHRLGLRSASGLGQIEVVRELLSRKGPGQPSLSRQEELDQALTYATIHGHREIMDLLLEGGANINSIPQVFGNPATALHMAPDVATARVLVAYGADLSIRDNTFQGTPADWAHQAGKTDVAEYLRDQMQGAGTAQIHTIADVPTKDSAKPAPKVHPLLSATAAGDLEAVRHILQTDATAVAVRTEDTERTALHLAADLGHLEIAKLLLASGADFYARDAHEQLPLDVAPGVELNEVHHYLRSINNERNRFLQVCMQGDIEQAKAMLQADPTLVHAKDIAEGTPPLIFAACKETPALLELLLKAGADPNAREWSTSWSPLYFCADNGHVENLKVLLKAGADPAIVWPVNYGATKMQMNALHVAAWKGHGEVVRLLLKVGVPVDGRARSYAQFTPLHLAVTDGHLKVARVLVENGANPRLRDGRRSIDALEMAKRGKHQVVVEYLDSVLKVK